MLYRYFGLIVLLQIFLPTVAQAEIWLHCGRVVDTERARLLGERWIQVRGNRIAAVQQQAPASQQIVIDLKDKTCLPGLIDLHTHLTYQLSDKSYSEKFKLNPADVTLRSVVYAKKTLLAGFTTVRNLGDSDNISAALKKAIEQEMVPGPRIFTALKTLSSTGGHGDPTNGLRTQLRWDTGPEDGVINSVADVRKAIRLHYQNGADLIKIAVTGGVLSVAASGDNPQLSATELRAIVETARDYDFRVAAHAHGKEGMTRAIEAGVHTIEHGTFMDNEIIHLMKKHGTWLIPTIIAGKHVAEKSKIEGWFPDTVRPKAKRIGAMSIKGFAHAYKGGVKIAFGTDAGVVPHGQNAKEFAYMVEGGMSPKQAIQTATRNAAQVLEHWHQLGSITKGKLADIIAVPGNPYTDVTLLQNVIFVMKNGKIFQTPNHTETNPNVGP